MPWAEPPRQGNSKESYSIMEIFFNKISQYLILLKSLNVLSFVKGRNVIFPFIPYAPVGPQGTSLVSFTFIIFFPSNAADLKHSRIKVYMQPQ